MLEKQRVRRAKAKSKRAASSSAANTSAPKNVPPVAKDTQNPSKTKSAKAIKSSAQQSTRKTALKQKEKRAETATGAPKTLLLADSDLRQTMYDESPM